MTKAFAQASVSLDGFIAGPDGTGIDRLFAWCTAGEVETPSTQPERLTYKTNAGTAEYLKALIDETGALVVGRRQFDQTKGRGGSHPMGTPVFVVTHEAPADWVNTDTPFTFVTDGIDSAVAQAKVVAGSKNVGVGPGSTVGQALQAGLIDELRMDLVPITLGGGTRMLEDLTKNPRAVGDPQIIQGVGVTHQIYP